MIKYRPILIAIAMSLSVKTQVHAQDNSAFQNKIGIAKDSASYPNVNTPNHNAIPPAINGTFDDPKILPDSSVLKRDNRSKENLDSLPTWNRNKRGNATLKKDSLHPEENLK